NWRARGYVAPGAAVERAWHRHPDDARVVPIRPSSELSLDADVCVVGSGAGGSLIAARLAAAGHRVVVLETGAYRTADDFTQREAEAFDTMFQGHGLLTTRDLAFSVLAGQTAGGSATINWMTCLRPPMWAREEWERDHGMAGVASAEFDGLLDDVWRRLRVTTAESAAGPAESRRRSAATAGRCRCTSGPGPSWRRGARCRRRRSSSGPACGRRGSAAGSGSTRRRPSSGNSRIRSGCGAGPCRRS